MFANSPWFKRYVVAFRGKMTKQQALKKRSEIEMAQTADRI
jgi:hypothetical protein